MRHRRAAGRRSPSTSGSSRVQCDLSDLAADREISRFLVVVGPPTATSVRLLDASGAVLRELPWTTGSPSSAHRAGSPRWT